MKLRLALVSCALAAVAFAADVTGKWSYEMQGRNGPMTATMTLKADGATLTGTVSGRGGDTEISDGKVDGANISFSVVREFNGNKFTSKYSGTLSGDELKLKIETQGQNGARPPVEVTAKRVSST
ncbi:MAG TPA: hypothetical protein VEU96_06015 [Bryobacteraceae bacterium]|nr:hypothetical protein [Bryobacteraceae bacterium]